MAGPIIPEAGRRIRWAVEAGLDAPSLEWLDPTASPESICVLRNLAELSLWHKSITRTPEWRRHLPAMSRNWDAHHEETLAYLQREFLQNFKRGQSPAESPCPPVFTLEVERPPDVPPRIWEGMWSDLRETPLPRNLTLYRNQPGEWRPVKTGRIEPPAKRLARLSPAAPKLVPATPQFHMLWLCEDHRAERVTR